MTNDQNPMSIENLPEYLKSIKNKNMVGESIVIDMGTIVVPNKSKKWTLVLACFIILGIGTGTWAYIQNESPKQITALIELDVESNPSQSIFDIVSNTGGQIMSISQNDDKTYEVKISTKNKHSSLEKIRKNKNVKKAE